jgi:hypothetical protein
MKNAALALTVVMVLQISAISGTLLVNKSEASAPNKLGVMLQLSHDIEYIQNMHVLNIPFHIQLENPYSSHYIITQAYDITVYVDGVAITGSYPPTKEICARLDWDLTLTLTEPTYGLHNVSVYVAAKYQYTGCLPDWYPTNLADGSGTSEEVTFSIKPFDSPPPTFLASPSLSPSLSPAPTMIPTPTPASPSLVTTPTPTSSPTPEFTLQPTPTEMATLTSTQQPTASPEPQGPPSMAYIVAAALSAAFAGAILILVFLKLRKRHTQG